VVPRPELIERLNRGTESTLTLVSAPAGFGKTTLLAEWRTAGSAGESSAAWLSLDPSDNQARPTILVLSDRRVADGGAGGRRDPPCAHAGADAANPSTLVRPDGLGSAPRPLSVQRRANRLWTGFRDYPGWGDDLEALAARRSTERAVVVLEPRTTAGFMEEPW
jgi:hypothetical protein